VQHNPKSRWLQNLGCMEKRVYKKSTRELAELKKRLVKVWADFEQTVVDRAVTDQWRKRLQACVKSKGQHFEQLL